MKKIIILTFLLIFSTSAYANKNKNTWDYPLRDYDGFSSLKRVSKTEVEFQYKDGSTKTFKLN